MLHGILNPKIINTHFKKHANTRADMKDFGHFITNDIMMYNDVQ